MSHFLDTPWGRFSEQIDEIRSDVRRADVNILKASEPQRRKLGRLKSGVIVWLSAALEDFVQSILQALIEEVEAKNPPLLRLRPCLIALCHHHVFDRISDSEKTGLGMWRLRLEVSENVLTKGAANFNSSALPLDGGTLKPKHFKHIWNFFGFPWYAFPRDSRSHETAILELATDRNDLAHGYEQPTRFGRSINSNELKNRVDLVEEAAEHLALAATKYIDGDLYLRQK